MRRGTGPLSLSAASRLPMLDAVVASDRGAMNDIRLARTRGSTPTARGSSPVNVELAWPPTTEDLDAIEVVEFEALRRPDRPPRAEAQTAHSSRPEPTRLLPAGVDVTDVMRPAPPAPVTLARAYERADVDDWASVELDARPVTPGGQRRGRGRAVGALLAVASMTLAASLWYLGWPLTALPIDVASQFSTPLPLPAATAPALIADRPAPPASVLEPADAEPSPAPALIGRPAPLEAASGVPAAAAPSDAEPSNPVRPPASPPLSQVYAARAPEPVGVPSPETTTRAIESAAPGAGIPYASVGSSAVSPPPAPATRPSEDSPVAVPTPAATAVVAEGGAPVPRASLPARPAKTDEMDVQTVLQRYERAYGQLDARAAQAVWPSVDVRALTRAFQGLESQALEFDRCELAVQGAVASADCLGRATYVRRVGSKAPRTEARAWSFRLRKIEDDWQILKVEIR